MSIKDKFKMRVGVISYYKYENYLNPKIKKTTIYMKVGIKLGMKFLN